MVRASLNSVLSVLLTVSLAICPYTCAEHPRSSAENYVNASAGCSHCDGCCPVPAEKPHPTDSALRFPLFTLPPSPAPSDGGSVPKQACSCPCVCKGALCELPGEFHIEELDPVATLAVASSPDVRTGSTFTTSVVQHPGTSPSKATSGREICALIGSLLL